MGNNRISMQMMKIASGQGAIGIAVVWVFEDLPATGTAVRLADRKHASAVYDLSHAALGRATRRRREALTKRRTK